MKKLLLAAAAFLMCTFGFAVSDEENLVMGIGAGFQHSKIDLDKFNLNGNFNGFNIHGAGIWSTGNNFATTFEFDAGFSELDQYKYVDEDDMFANFRFSLGEGIILVHTDKFLVLPYAFVGFDFLQYKKDYIDFSIDTFNAGAGINATYFFSDIVGLSLFVRDSYNIASMVDFSNSRLHDSVKYNSYGKGYMIDGGLFVVFRTH